MATLDPDLLTKAWDQICILMDTSWICFCFTVTGTPLGQSFKYILWHNHPRVCSKKARKWQKYTPSIYIMANQRSNWTSKVKEVLAYARATATPDPSRICNLHHSSWERWIFNPLSEARNLTRNLMAPSRIHFHYAMMGTPKQQHFYPLLTNNIF